MDGRPRPEDGGLVRRWSHRLIEPPVMFTGITVAILVIIWYATFDLGARERAAAHRSAAALATEQADTYEAQIVRALREIDNTLKLVRHNLGSAPPRDVLQELRSEELLPPELLFTVIVTDAEGDVVASTHRSDADTVENVSASEDFQRAWEADGMMIGQPRRSEDTGEWRLSFLRRVEDGDRGFAGIVAVSVHAGYFVSGYDPGALGDHGALGLLGTDGVFRVRRTGESESAGTRVDYESLVPEVDTDGAPVEVAVNPWDGVRRYSVARELFEFPLAIVVGVSQAERLAPAAELERTYRWRASGASALVLAVMALLGRLSWQLQNARTRVMEERIAHARRVEYLAFHDNLTDLPNRAFFNRLLTQGVQQGRRYERRMALLFLDLDRFKVINDSLGHEAGDELLVEIGRRLRASVRESDVVARLGGDEFVILLPEVEHPSNVAPVADKILAAVGKPFTLAGQEFRITVSIGATLFPDDGQDEQTLMKHADVAMYHAKETGRNNFQFFSEQLNTDSLERLALESSLRNALMNDEFRLFYQAKRDMITGEITGMEALLRWDHPDLGLTEPMKFLPLAEENGLIVPIGRWVINTACRQNVAWQEQGFPPLSMAVNLSARQFSDAELLKDIKGALHETGMAPELLEVEITESMIMQNMAQTVEVLNELKAMGVRIAIDDFGTGYSSLSTLKAFPLDTIKIDGSFIRDLAHSGEEENLTDAVIALGKSLSLTVVAEGVESMEQADFLRAHSCDQFQGFYINKPMPADEFARQFGEQFRAVASPEQQG